MLRAIAALLLAIPALAHAQPASQPAPVTRSHAITILGTPALPANFPNFPYVNPEAPKGGEAAFGMSGNFDGFNPYILRGNSAFGLGASWQPGVGGTAAGSAGGHVWESLLVGSANEPDTGYGLLAQTIELPADRMWAAFEIRPEARFADGTPVLASDVAWTYKTLLEKGRPSYRIMLADVEDCVAEGERRVVFHFKTNENRELPLIVGGLPVLPERWWSTRDFSRPLTEAPMGSGPYRVERFELGRSVTYARRPDWWAKDLPVGIGFHNLDRVRLEYFGDDTVLFEAFKAGQIDYRQENISKQWATAYEFPAITAGLARKEEIPHKLPTGIQGWVMNTRRPMFQDARVREALGQVWDFEWTNRNLFYGLYTRMTSYFGNTPQESKGVPDAAELALLEPFRKDLPAALFTEPFTIPSTDGSGNNRDGLRRALALLKDAGWTVRDRKLVNAAGEQMSFTILLNQPSLERIALPYVQWLNRLGIEVKVRSVDPAQFVRLMDKFDFDMTTIIYPGGELPGNELRDEFTCEAANTEGSGNAAGVCSPAVDALVARIVGADNRETIATAGRALDRVLLRGWYLIPHYHNPSFRIATWDRFGRPDTPVRSGFVLDAWWLDPAKAAHVDPARGTGK